MAGACDSNAESIVLAVKLFFCKFHRMNSHPDKPHRLPSIFQNYAAPLYFVTFCTAGRKPLLATDSVCEKFRQFAEQALGHGVAFGRYVIMPDHIHCFVRLAPDQKLSITIRLLKRALSSAIDAPMPHWQPGFFDRLLRHSESYSEKWNYVYQNPVRAGLVEAPEDWRFQGEIVVIRY
jgi:REP element-mobilizing transposase RayT